MPHSNGNPSPLRRAIIATDSSDYARAATAFASALAWPAQAVISVASVIDAPNPSDLPIRQWEERALADWRAILEYCHANERERALVNIAEVTEALRARHPGVALEEVVRVGEPAAELLALARSVDAELVIAGARGCTALEGLLLGSVSEALVNEAPCSVLIARQAVEEIRVVLVALRTPADADRLAEACLRLPLPPEARVVAVTAGAPRPLGSSAERPFAPGKVDAFLAAWDDAERAEAEAAGQRFVEQMRAGDPQRIIETRVVRGELRPSAFEDRADVAPALLAEAASLGADLIVVGARERPGFTARLGLGSVSRKLVRRAPMAVLVVRDVSSPE